METFQINAVTYVDMDKVLMPTTVGFGVLDTTGPVASGAVMHVLHTLVLYCSSNAFKSIKRPSLVSLLQVVERLYSITN